MDVVANPVQDVYHYHYTGGVQTFTVPAGITSISVDAYGASGTTGAGQAGKGGRVQANLTVTPGDTLYLYVGEAPHYLNWGIQPGGWNGGGDGPNTGNIGVGFPGGGATDIRIGGTGLNNRVIVAGGGGGKANGSTYGGGHGGGLVGQNGGGGSNSAGPEYGRGGSQFSGGAGGYAWYGDGTPTYTIRPSSNGQFGQGGTGDTNSGGGGGGYYGGGGGADGSGGGGGSSYTDPTLSSTVVHTQGVQTGSGQLTITVTQGDGPDVIRPVITVTSGVDTVLQGSTWTDAGATADTGETVTVVSNTVDTSAAGIYTVTYSATDAAGNVGTATRIVTVDLDTLNANGTAVQWAHTTGNNDGIHYDLAQPLELRAPPGYTVVLKNATGIYEYNEYDTGLEFVSDVEALLVSTGNMNGRGYGGLWYRDGNINWDQIPNSFVAFARPLPDTTAPVITSGGVGIGLFENSGTGQSVYTIAASDAIGVVSYAIGGTDAVSLTVNQTTGVVTFNADPDYEAKNSYSFTVTASDAAGNTSEPTTVTFSIADVDEIPPVITSGGLGIGLFENSGSGQSVYTIAASDADGVVSYAIGGTDAASLTLDGNVVSLIADPDYETKNSYSFTVTASDDAGNTSDPTTVTFSITSPTVKNAYEIQIDANTNIALDSTVDGVGGLWSWYSNGVASDPSNSLSVFLASVRNATTHRMSHSASNPGSLSQTSGTGTSAYSYPGIPGSGNDDSAKGVVLKYTAIEERELLIETTGGAYDDSVVVIFTEAHLNGGNAPFRVVTMDSGDQTTFKVKFPYFPDN
ncbi:glycine-rich protein, partial [Akkermansiaceae bacterium]|nr:glycine-rich protein [Akkermansiaceae bacterium]